MTKRLLLLFFLALFLCSCSPKPYGEVVVVNLATTEPIVFIRTRERSIEVPGHPSYGQMGIVRLEPGVHEVLTAVVKGYVVVERVEKCIHLVCWSSGELPSPLPSWATMLWGIRPGPRLFCP